MPSDFWSRSENKNNREYKRFRKLILNRDGYRCQIRGPRCLGRATQVDHIVPVNRANLCDPSNCRAACATCNASKAGADRAYRQRGVTDPAPRVVPWWQTANPQPNPPPTR
jgi:5-methylcytosine-specific restriction endonuclease McrA